LIRNGILEGKGATSKRASEVSTPMHRGQILSRNFGTKKQNKHRGVKA